MAESSEPHQPSTRPPAGRSVTEPSTNYARTPEREPSYTRLVYLDGTVEDIRHENAPPVLQKLAKWAAYPSFGQRAGATRFIPGKTPLAEEILANWTLEEPPKYPHSVPRFMEAVRQRGDDIGMFIDLSNHDCLYAQDLPVHVEYRHIELVAKVYPSAKAIDLVIHTANEFWSRKPDMAVAIHCAYGFNRTGFVVCCYLIQHGGMAIEDAVAAFAAARPPGIKHMDFVLELYNRYAPDRVPAALAQCVAAEEVAAKEEQDTAPADDADVAAAAAGATPGAGDWAGTGGRGPLVGEARVSCGEGPSFAAPAAAAREQCSSAIGACSSSTCGSASGALAPAKASGGLAAAAAAAHGCSGGDMGTTIPFPEALRAAAPASGYPLPNGDTAGTNSITDGAIPSGSHAVPSSKRTVPHGNQAAAAGSTRPGSSVAFTQTSSSSDPAKAMQSAFAPLAIRCSPATCRSDSGAAGSRGGDGPGDLPGVAGDQVIPEYESGEYSRVSTLLEATTPRLNPQTSKTLARALTEDFLSSSPPHQCRLSAFTRRSLSQALSRHADRTGLTDTGHSASPLPTRVPHLGRSTSALPVLGVAAAADGRMGSVGAAMQIPRGQPVCSGEQMEAVHGNLGPNAALPLGHQHQQQGGLMQQQQRLPSQHTASLLSNDSLGEGLAWELLRCLRPSLDHPGSPPLPATSPSAATAAVAASEQGQVQD